MALGPGFYLQDIILYGNPCRKIVAVPKKLAAVVRITEEDVKGVRRDLQTVVWTARHKGLVWCDDKWVDANELLASGILQ